MREISMMPQPPVSSPSPTPCWIGSGPAAGSRGDQPEQPSDGIEKPENEKLYTKVKPSKLNLPAPDRATEQHGPLHHRQQAPGCRGEAQEGAAREGRSCSPTVWLERTAATKRGYEDDSENGKAENTIAPKKMKEGFKNVKYLGGGKKPLRNLRLPMNSTPSKKKLQTSTSKLLRSRICNLN